MCIRDRFFVHCQPSLWNPVSVPVYPEQMVLVSASDPVLVLDLVLDSVPVLDLDLALDLLEFLP